jgi:hypothetical protein
MSLRLLRLTTAAVLAFALFASTSGAKEAVSVTATATRSGVVALGCGPVPVISTPAEFILSRTGDNTDGLTVTIAWSGALSKGESIEPTSVGFAPGESMASVMPIFSTVPTSEGN